MPKLNPDKVKQIALQWDLKPEQIEGFYKMVHSAPWALVQGIINEIKDGSNKDLLNANEERELFRAQGRLLAIHTLTSRMEAFVKEVEDDS